MLNTDYTLSKITEAEDIFRLLNDHAEMLTSTDCPITLSEEELMLLGNIAEWSNILIKETAFYKQKIKDIFISGNNS